MRHIDTLIPQVILRVDDKVVSYYQEQHPCFECMKECKSVWLTWDQFAGNFLSKPSYIQDVIYVFVSNFSKVGIKVERICLTYGDVSKLKDCDSCIHFHDAIVK